MVAAYQQIHRKTDVLGAANALLALMGIDDPSPEQSTGALLLGEFVLKVNHNLRLK